MEVISKSRRRLARQLLGAGLYLQLESPLTGMDRGLVIQDIANRRVGITRRPRRILLGDGTLAYVWALLQPGRPFDDIVGWGANFKTADLDGYRAYLRRFPEIAEIPSFPASTQSSMGREWALALRPDIVVMNLSSKSAAEGSGLMDSLAEVGIPVVFVDFRTRIVGHTVASVELLGRVLGRGRRANAFLRFRSQQIRRVTEPLRHIRARPRVMIERAAGLYDDCCLSYGNGNFGELVDLAGGDNIGSHALHSAYGSLHPEQVIAAQPEVIVVTGANWSLYSPLGDWVNLGPGADPIEGQRRLQRLMQRVAYRSLPAVAARRVHAIWHPFYDNPYYFIALQCLAKWFHPDLFAALDPDATFQELHSRFLPVAYQAGYWLDLEAAA